AVDKRDPIPMRTLLDHLRRQRPLLPGLANDGEPVAANLVLRDRIEGTEQILESFEGPDHTEEQDITDRIARNLLRRIDAVLVVGTMGHYQNRAPCPVLPAHGGAIVVRVDDGSARQAQEQWGDHSNIGAKQWHARLTGIEHL